MHVYQKKGKRERTKHILLDDLIATREYAERKRMRVQKRAERIAEEEEESNGLYESIVWNVINVATVQYYKQTLRGWQEAKERGAKSVKDEQIRFEYYMKLFLFPSRYTYTHSHTHSSRYTLHTYAWYRFRNWKNEKANKREQEKDRNIVSIIGVFARIMRIFVIRRT